LLVDHMGNVLYVSEGCAEAFGYTRQEIEQISASGFVLAIDINELPDPLASGGRDLLGSRFLVKHKDGRRLRMDGSIKRIRLQGTDEVKLLMFYPPTNTIHSGDHNHERLALLAECAIHKLKYI